jgi:hypothetical protein
MAGDEARHERAMPEGVKEAEVRCLGLEGEVRAAHDLARLVQAHDRADARVDDRDVDACTGEAGGPEGVRPDEPQGAVHRPDVGPRRVAAALKLQGGVPSDGHDGRIGGNSSDGVAGNVGREAIDDRKVQRDGAASRLD